MKEKHFTVADLITVLHRFPQDALVHISGPSARLHRVLVMCTSPRDVIFNRHPLPLALETFLAQFPDNAESWAQATDELPDMYRWISKNGERFPPVGRENCRTPAEWNQKYKAAIREHFNDLSDVEKDELFKTFEQWFE